MRAIILVAMLAAGSASAQSIRPASGGSGGTFTGGTLTSQLVLDATNTLCSEALALCYSGDTDTGIQRAAANTLALCVNGVAALTLSTTGMTTALTYTSTIASGSNAFAVATNGARIDFGAGASDYASSDGTTVTFAATVSAFQYINAISWIKADTFLAASSVNLTVSAATAPTATNNRLSSSGAVNWTPIAPPNNPSGALMHACNVDAESDVITMTDGATYEGTGCVLGVNDCVSASWDFVSTKWRETACSNN